MDSIPVWLRCLGCITYLLPWSTALLFSTSILDMGIVPFVVRKLLMAPVLPLLEVNRLLPLGLGSLLLPILLFLAVVRNPKMPFFLRFNTLQAILLDLLLVVTNYIILFACDPGAEADFLCDTFNNTFFLGSVLVLAFSVVQCIRGLEPEIPSLSDAVRTQLWFF